MTLKALDVQQCFSHENVCVCGGVSVCNSVMKQFPLRGGLGLLVCVNEIPDLPHVATSLPVLA